jgi:hypothetical protein
LVILMIVMLYWPLRSTERGGRYRPDRWRPLDTWIAGLSLGTGAVYLLTALLAPKLLSYYPYPQASWPGLDWPLAMILALMAMPVVSALHD